MHASCLVEELEGHVEPKEDAGADEGELEGVLVLIIMFWVSEGGLCKRVRG